MSKKNEKTAALRRLREAQAAASSKSTSKRKANGKPNGKNGHRALRPGGNGHDILVALSKVGDKGATAPELGKQLKLPDSIWQSVHPLVGRGYVKRIGRGVYAITASGKEALKVANRASA